MRALIIALVVMIFAVAAGTAGLVALQIAKADPTQPDPSAAKPAATKRERPPATEPEKVSTGKAEELPPVPKLGDKSKLTAMNKEKTLYIETAEDGSKRVLFAAEVCLKDGVMLEVLVCKKDTKEHESILRTDIDARFIHAALEGVGAKAGKPVQFINPKTQEEEYKPASGQRMEVEVHFGRDGKVAQERAQEWLLDQKTKKPLASEWVFSGSRFVKIPDRPDLPPFYCANNGEVIAVSNFFDSMLDLPVPISQDSADLHFKAAYKRIPPPGSMVWVILTPLPDKKDEKK